MVATYRPITSARRAELRKRANKGDQRAAERLRLDQEEQAEHALEKRRGVLKARVDAGHHRTI